MIAARLIRPLKLGTRIAPDLNMTTSISQFVGQSSDSGAGLFAGMGILILVFWAIALIGTVFWLWMLIDCLTSAMPANEKVLWFLVIFFLHLLGALLYFFMIRSGRGTTT
jgi:hypothetical protein